MARIPLPVWAFPALAVGFVIWGVTALAPSREEARLGLAAGEVWGAYGRIYDGWHAQLWPLQVGLSHIYAQLFEAGIPSTGAIRWPAALAAVALGAIVLVRVGRLAGARAACLAGAAWFGSLAVIDRSAAGWFDLVGGIGLAIALERCATRKCDPWTGLAMIVAVLGGGWAGIVLAGLCLLVQKPVTIREVAWVLGPAGAAIAGWSAWMIVEGGTSLWIHVLGLPLQRGVGWWLIPAAVIGGLPLGIFGAFSVLPSVRQSLGDLAGHRTSERPSPTPEAMESWIRRWHRIILVCGLAGSAIPGLAVAAWPTLAVGLAMLAGVVLDRAWSRSWRSTWSPWTRTTFWSIGLAMLGTWSVTIISAYLIIGNAVPFYRGVGVLVSLLAAWSMVVGLGAARAGRSGLMIVMLLLISVGLKVAYVGHLAPEFSYRRSLAAWGRAIGQWVPPYLEPGQRWPIYVVNPWPYDLALATGHPIRQLPHAESLAFVGEEVAFVLLRASVFEHWPESAPELVEVMRFHDDLGPRLILDPKDQNPKLVAKWVLARTPGDLTWQTRLEQRLRAERGGGDRQSPLADEPTPALGQPELR